MKLYIVITVTAFVAAMAVFSFVAIRRAHAIDTRCCHTVSPYEPCSGCVKISSDPAEYVSAGNNPANKCQGTQLSKSCDESNLPCFVLTNVDLYDDASCSHKVGTVTLGKNVGQCDEYDDSCNSE